MRTRLTIGALVLAVTFAAVAPLVCEVECAHRPAAGAAEPACHGQSAADRLVSVRSCAHESLTGAPETTVRLARGLAVSALAILPSTSSTRALDRSRASWLADRSGAPHAPLRSPAILRI